MAEEGGTEATGEQEVSEAELSRVWKIGQVTEEGERRSGNRFQALSEEEFPEIGPGKGEGVRDGMPRS